MLGIQFSVFLLKEHCGIDIFAVAECCDKFIAFSYTIILSSVEIILISEGICPLLGILELLESFKGFNLLSHLYMQHLIAHVLKLIDSGIVLTCDSLEFVISINGLNYIFFLDVELAEIVADILVLGTLSVSESEKVDGVIISHDLSVKVADTDKGLNGLFLPIDGIRYGSCIEIVLFIYKIVYFL